MIFTGKHLKIRLKKATALFIALSFLFSNIVFAETPQETGPDVKKQAETVVDPAKIVVPRDYGLVKSRYAAPGSNKLVVHIQDAHCNYEAQSNIIKVLECLIKNDGLSLISVEGADGFIDTSWFKAFPDAEIRKEVADYFMKKGEITGPEFLTITSDYPIKLFGAETRAYYLENLNAFTSSYPLKEDTEKYFNQIKAAINKLKSYIYGDELKELDLKMQDYEAKKLSFTDYVKYLEGLGVKYKINMRQYENLFKLISVLIYEKKIDFNIVDKERAALIDAITKKLDKAQLSELVNKSLEFKLSKISSAEYYDYLRGLAAKYGVSLQAEYPNLLNYVIYNGVYSKIENEELFSEIKKFEEAVKEKIFSNDDQRTLDRLYRHINILVGLVNIKLLNDDFDYYKANKDGFSYEAFALFINKMASRYGLNYEVDAPSQAVTESMPKMEDFYSVAIKRDKALVDNTIEAMNKTGSPISVLVTGGFHSEGMTKLLETQGVSYIVVCPNITKDVETPYIKILTNQRTSLEEILADTGATSPPDAKSVKGNLLAPYLLTAARINNIAEIVGRTEADLKEWAERSIGLWMPGTIKDLEKMRIDPTAEVIAVRFDMGVDKAVEEYTAAGSPAGIEIVGMKKNAESVKRMARPIIESLLRERTLAAAVMVPAPVKEGVNVEELLITAKAGIDEYLKTQLDNNKITEELYNEAINGTYKNLATWVTDPDIQRVSPNTRIAILAAIKDAIGTGNWADIVDVFRKDVSFGTAGIREKAALTEDALKKLAQYGPGAAVLKGPNTINDIVLLIKTAGVIKYAKENGLRKVVIGYDSRIVGKQFAQLIAQSFLANSTSDHKFTIYLFDEASPFPELSFAVTTKAVRADLGILISASHNPSNYNGYKITNFTGAQLTGKMRDAIVEAVKGVGPKDIQLKPLREAGDGQLVWLGGTDRLPGQDYSDGKYERQLIDMHTLHVDQVKKFIIDKATVRDNASKVKVGFSAFNGAGNRAVPRLLREIGFTDTKVIASLQEMNGMFPAFGWGEQPDPGDPISADIAVREFIKEHGQEAFDALDILIGTDPDADRAGMIIKVPLSQQKYYGKYKLLSANDAWTLLLWYRMQRLAELNGGKLPDAGKKYIAFSHVTTDALERVGKLFGVRSLGEMRNKKGEEAGGYLNGRRSWVGFSLIAEFCQTAREKGLTNIGGAEESNGFSILGGPAKAGEILSDDGHVNDKDGTFAALLLSEVAAYAKSKDTTLFEMLDSIYLDPGVGYFATANKPMPRVGAFKGAEGLTKKINLLKRAQAWAADANKRSGTKDPFVLAGLLVIGALEFRTTKYDKDHYEGFPDEGVRFFFADPGLNPGDPFTNSRNYLTIRPSGTSQTIRFYTQLFGEGIDDKNLGDVKYQTAKRAEAISLQSQVELLAAERYSEDIANVETQLKDSGFVPGDVVRVIQGKSNIDLPGIKGMDVFDHSIATIMQSSSAGERVRKAVEMKFKEDAKTLEPAHLILVKSAIPEKQLTGTTAINLANLCADYYNGVGGYTAHVVDSYEAALELLAKNNDWNKNNTIIGLVDAKQLDAMSTELATNGMEDKTKVLAMEKFSDDQFVPLKGFFDLMSVMVRINKPLDKAVDRELLEGIRDLLNEIGIRDVNSLVEAFSMGGYIEDPIKFARKYVIRLLPAAKPKDLKELKQLYEAAKKVVESL